MTTAINNKEYDRVHYQQCIINNNSRASMQFVQVLAKPILCICMIHFRSNSSEHPSEDTCQWKRSGMRNS